MKMQSRKAVKSGKVVTVDEPNMSRWKQKSSGKRKVSKQRHPSNYMVSSPPVPTITAVPYQSQEYVQDSPSLLGNMHSIHENNCR